MKHKLGMMMGLFLILGISMVHAGGLGVSPSIMDLDELARGNTYERNLKVLNTEGDDVVVGITPQGNASAWLTILDPETSEPIESAEIDAGGQRSFLVEFAIPDDAPNGDYTGFFDIQPQGDAQVSIIVQGYYTFSVTGTQRKDGSIGSIVAADTESGQPLRVRYDFRNTGNVATAPTIEVVISKDGQEVDTVSGTGTVVNAGEHEIQIFEWDTENRGVGNFTADVKVYVDDKQVGERVLDFAVAPRGTFTLDAIISELRGPEEWTVDEPGKFTIQVFNVGKLDFNAKAVVEVYDGDRLVDVLESTEKRIVATRDAELELFFTPDESGQFRFESTVTYGGEEKELKSVPVTVRSEDEASVNTDLVGDNANTQMLILIGVIAVLVVAVLILVVVLVKKK